MPRYRITPERLVENFHKRYRVVESGCWEWTAGATGSGYGVIWDGSKGWRAHGLSYTLHKGPIPDGLTIDHLCRNTLCVNPGHLEAVTGRVNTLRNTGPSAINAKKTHCINGHEFSDENTRINKDGSRGCRTCTNANWRNHREARRQQARRRVECPDCGLGMTRKSLPRHRARMHETEGRRTTSDNSTER